MGCGLAACTLLVLTLLLLTALPESDDLWIEVESDKPLLEVPEEELGEVVLVTFLLACPSVGHEIAPATSPITTTDHFDASIFDFILYSQPNVLSASRHSPAEYFAA